ncbi:MAG: TolC family protein [Rhizobiaceae bacterium]
MLTAGVSPTFAVSLKEAVSVALDSNPNIGEAIENREAIEFELRQAKGLLLPSIDLEAGAGVRRLDNPSRRAIDREDDTLEPVDVGVVITQKLFDGGRIRAEMDRQASRVDSASYRVLERSQYIALQVVREYLEYMLQSEIVGTSAENVRRHRRIAGNIRSGSAGGTLTEADNQQARERVLAAQARLQSAEEELAAARIRFRRLAGVPIGRTSHPGSYARYIPSTLSKAIGLGRTNNPRVHLARADIDAADAQVDAAKADKLPEVVLEGRARTGHDIDGAEGRTTDLQGRVVMKWNLWRGGIKEANEQEQVRRASEQRMILHQVHRQIEEAVRTSWDRRLKQKRLAGTLTVQAKQNARLVNSYQQQFSVGKRSLLDVLDAQNTRYNVDVLAKTARYASLFAEYRLLASTGQLLEVLKLKAPKQSEAYARAEFNVPETVAAETHRRTPSRQVNNLPMDLLAPIRRKN